MSNALLKYIFSRKNEKEILRTSKTDDRGVDIAMYNSMEEIGHTLAGGTNARRVNIDTRA